MQKALNTEYDGKLIIISECKVLFQTIIGRMPEICIKVKQKKKIGSYQ